MGNLQQNSSCWLTGASLNMEQFNVQQINGTGTWEEVKRGTILEQKMLKKKSNAVCVDLFLDLNLNKMDGKKNWENWGNIINLSTELLGSIYGDTIRYNII